MKTTISTSVRRDLQQIVMENDALRVVIIPEIGGKITELTDQKTHRQFLLPPQSANGWYRKGTYGGDFSESDVSGFDECFPTVSPSGAFPDHGELWSRPWSYEIHDDSVALRIKGVQADYLFERTMTLEGNRIRFDYRVTNTMASPFPCVWSAHPLLTVSETSQIILPRSVNEILLNWASDPAFGSCGSVLPWPSLSADGSRPVDYSRVQPKHRGFAAKCFTHALDEGFAGLYDAAADQSILFEFETKEIPYLGLWLCYGGWPEDGREKHYTVGLEPCTGRPDALNQAIERNECDRIPAGGTRTWSFHTSVWKGKPPIMCQ